VPVAKRVFLHIGAPKTGTTYLQAVLAHNRQALRAKDILYPRALADAHHTAAWDLRGTPAQRKDAQGIDGAWDALVSRANSWTGHTVVISSEMLVYCNDAQVATAVGAFPAEVHVVYTARDLARQVPAVWQERIKNQQTLTYDEFVDSVVHPAAAPGPHGFWRAQDASRVLERWSAQVPPSRVHVVTTPPAGQPGSVLLERFAGVLGLSPTDLSTDLPTAANESLGLLQTELLRHYNLRHGRDMPWPLYRRTIRLQLATAFGAVHDERRPTLTVAQRDVLTRRAEEIVEQLGRAGYDVVGDLADLVPADVVTGSRSGPGVAAAPVTTGELLDAAVDVMHAALSSQEAQRRKTKRGASTSADPAEVSDA
jgi:hypothetical protein